MTLFEEERQDDVQRHVYHDGDCEHSFVLSEANARPGASTAVFKVQSSCSTSVVLRLQVCHVTSSQNKVQKLNMLHTTKHHGTRTKPGTPLTVSE